MDRCALFVDAGYVLADGAMAVHGTRRRESVSWDYAGLLQLLASLARERSGLPLLRCYWYEATVEGRRSADHDALADLPGVKLRLAKMRPGRREGVEGEIHRDLTTLARNKAVSDAVVVSAEEDLAQVVADVQDLGMRVTLLHIAVDGNWTISRTLRQECDDIVEISSAHLRPYVELIPGAEPPRPDERDGASLITLRPTVNGHGPYPPSAAGMDNGHQAPPSIYTAPVVAEYQRSAPQLSRQRPEDPAAAREDPQAGARAGMPAGVPEPPARPDIQPVRRDAPAARRDQAEASAEPVMAASAEYLSAPPDLAVVQPDQAPVQQEVVPIRQEQPGVRQDPAAVLQEPQPARPDYGARPDLVTRQEMYAAPVAVPVTPDDQPIELPGARSRAVTDISGYNPGAMREQPPLDAMTREPLPGEPGEGLQPVPVAPGSAQVRRLPTRATGQSGSGFGQPPAGQLPGGQFPGGQAAAPSVPSAPTAVQPMPGQPGAAQPGGVQPGGQPAAPVMPIVPGAGYPAVRNGSYSGPRPVVPVGPAGPGGPAAPGGPVAAGGPAGLAGQPAVPAGPSGLVGPAGVQPVPGPAAPGVPVPMGTPADAMSGIGQPNAFGQGAAAGGPSGPVGPLGPVGPVAYSGAQPGVSLADAVQSAHEEGKEFGESVARDAPALWLEAVLARKPRMPSDLEARLLQGSALPIDFLLHDEVRHALRRGFWDALERARR